MLVMTLLWAARLLCTTSLHTTAPPSHLTWCRPCSSVLLGCAQLLHLSGLNSAATGGLSSYALVLMSTSLLQQHAGSAGSLGELLVRSLATLHRPCCLAI